MPINLSGCILRNGYNDLTFAGILHLCWDDLVEENGWSEELRKQYERNYTRRVVRYLPELKSIKDMTLEDLTTGIDMMARDREHSSTTRASYWHLVCLVIEWAAKKGYCQDLFWGKTASLPSEDESGKARQMLSRIPKSFSSAQNIELSLIYLKAPDIMDGERFGELIMHGCGVRNNEACGLDFGDIRPLPGYPWVYCLYIYSTTSIGSTKRKAGGKTRNADRIIPIPTVYARAILLRKKRIAGLIESGQYITSGEFAGCSVDELPMVCRGQDYQQGCKTDDLSRSALMTFRTLGDFNEKTLAAAERDASEGEQEIEEDAPTAYLFRRNMATMLSNLGMPLDMIQYYIGHDIEFTEKVRNDFVNPDVLYEIWKYIEENPINRLFFPAQETLDVTGDMRLGGQSEVVIRSTDADTVIRIFAEAAEPDEEITVKCIKGETEELHMRKTVDVKQTANIQREMQKVYRDKAEAKGFIKPEWIDEE